MPDDKDPKHQRPLDMQTTRRFDPTKPLDARPTVRLDPTKPSWPVVVASLEQLNTWALLAFRLGILALIQECVRELATVTPREGVLSRLRELVDVLVYLPLEK